MSKYWMVAKVNFKKTTWIAYLTSAICVLAMLVDYIVDRTMANTGDSTVSMYCMLYLVCILAPIFIASVNYTKMMHIGVKKKTYFGGCIINYVIFAAVIAMLGVIGHYVIDPIMGKYETVYGLISVFKWDISVIGAFFSQFSFLLLVEAVIHTLVFMQTKWYGWVADLLIVAIISVFTPIPALRAAEVFFFRFTIFQQPAIIHIAVCLILAVLIYITNLFYLKKRDND